VHSVEPVKTHPSVQPHLNAGPPLTRLHVPPPSSSVQSLCPFVQESVAAEKVGTCVKWFVRKVVQMRNIIYRLFVLIVRKV